MTDNHTRLVYAHNDALLIYLVADRPESVDLFLSRARARYHKNLAPIHADTDWQAFWRMQFELAMCRDCTTYVITYDAETKEMTSDILALYPPSFKFCDAVYVLQQPSPDSPVYVKSVHFKTGNGE